MSVQKQLLEKIGEGLVKQFKTSIEPVKASGKTAQSIHAVTTETTVEVLADRHIWALEDGRKPTGSNAKKGNPTLFEQIKEWAKIKGIVTNVNDPKQLGIVYAITKKIHREGWRPRLDKPLTKVIQSIDEDSLLRDLIASQITIYNDRVVKSVNQL